LSAIKDQIDEQTIFVGHSLGVLFALAVLEKLIIRFTPHSHRAGHQGIGK